MRAQIDALLAATWPPASVRRLGPWILRDGAGGGKRVEAASTAGAVGERDIDDAERAMDDAGRQALFAVFAGQDDLDRRLGDRAYLTLDPTVLYAGPVADLPAPDGPVDTAWPPTEAQEEIWRAGGIGAARLAVMERAQSPKTTLHLSHDGTACCTAFVAVHGRVAMLHALEVAKAHRRQGAGRAMMAHVAAWAAGQGADTLALLVTRANAPANALYRDLGLRGEDCYHYRIRP
ncbi:GNAT family N-acetyltransferase [Maribius pontilimi]|uniref:GNAT family N-acetyltransferase n=1 Tax=Palleronia pontilimi TaxID=1964209 RepID=A0A934I733_9RHOB|nr:GNAT family N-acetyltransferase [Palleronia pontilimi]